MTLSITTACIACDCCYVECPTEAVVPGSPRYAINPDYCTECELCTDVCPTNAIVTD